MAIEKNYPLNEAAPIMGITLGTLRQYVAYGMVESLKIGRKRVIPTHVLERICSEGLEIKRLDKRTTRKAG